MLSPEDKEEIIRWYEHKGREFPWRRNSLSPFKILITEILLQRTRAETVANMWGDFFTEYPDLRSIDQTSETLLSQELNPLGFHNRRARDIKRTVEHLLNEYDGEIPSKEGSLLELPGVGLYIANSTLCFGFNEKRPIVDTNVKRIYEFLFDLEFEDDLRRDDKVWSIAEENLPDQKFKKFNWSLLDLGAEMREKEPEVLLRIKKGS